MKAESFKIADGVYWVGAIDLDRRSFHGFGIPGSTYNCYLVFGDEKVALIDNVEHGMSNQLFARIEDAFAKEGKDDVKIDVLIQNHSEMDHTVCLWETVNKFSDAELYCSKKCEEFLQAQFHDFRGYDMNVVKTGDTLDLGGKTLAFVSAPMLHWPDSMFTMYMEEGILFSNDAFGQHLALSKRYAEDYDLGFILDHSKRFYANLVVLGSMTLTRKFDELNDLGILEQVKMIAPCHGQIWKNPEPIVEAYQNWASGVCKDKITVIYDTMHHSTQKMAHAIAEGIMTEGVECVLYFMQENTPDEIVHDVLESKAIALGAPTMMNKPYPRIGSTMYWLDCLNFKGTGSFKKALVFSSKGWAGGAIKKLTSELENAGFDVCDSYEATFVPDSDVLDECFERGKALAKSIKGE